MFTNYYSVRTTFKDGSIRYTFLEGGTTMKELMNAGVIDIKILGGV